MFNNSHLWEGLFDHSWLKYYCCISTPTPKLELTKTFMCGEKNANVKILFNKNIEFEE